MKQQYQAILLINLINGTFAKENAIFEPNAMHLSTISKKSTPNNRVVLLKSYSENGFVFFTNYNSQKAQDINHNNHVSLSFFWPNIEQQIHISGTAEQINDDISDAYFNSRPRDSQLSAWASNQSERVTNRNELEEKMSHFNKKFQLDVPRPPHWGGYRVTPTKYEFWQGRKNRFHDRIIYKKTINGWETYRLNP